MVFGSFEGAIEVCSSVRTVFDSISRAGIGLSVVPASTIDKDEDVRGFMILVIADISLFWFAGAPVELVVEFLERFAVGRGCIKSFILSDCDG
jgi:hypothetical protein